MTARRPAGDRWQRSRTRRFVLSGFIATAVDVGLAVGLTVVGFDRWLANGLALPAAAIVSLGFHRRVTLRGDTLDRWIRQRTVFFATATIAGVVDQAIFLSVHGATFYAKIVALAGAAVVRAGFHRAVLFRVVRREQSLPAGRALAPGVVRLSVVIPAYSEEHRIGVSIATIREQLSVLHADGELEIVVVDDGSTDATAEAARSAGADQVVVQPENRGKGAAVRAGVAASTGRTVAFTDADLAYAPRHLLDFLDAIESGFDVAIGNRHHPGAATLTGTSALRSFGSRVVNMASNIMLLGNYRDTQCGCKAFRSDAARVVLGAGIVDGFAFDIEVLHLVERYGLTMVELPVEVVNSEASTVSAIRDGVGVIIDILRVRATARRGRYPSLAVNAVPSGHERTTSTETVPSAESDSSD